MNSYDLDQAFLSLVISFLDSSLLFKGLVVLLLSIISSRLKQILELQKSYKEKK